MSKESIAQITLNANEELVKRTKKQVQRSFFMVGKEKWMNSAAKGETPDWKYQGVDFIDLFTCMSKREQNTVRFMKNLVKYNKELGGLDFRITVTPESPDLLMADMTYEVFLKGYQLLYKKDLVRRLKRNVYMFNPNFIIPSYEGVFFNSLWNDAKAHPQAPTYD